MNEPTKRKMSKGKKARPNLNKYLEANNMNGMIESLVIATHTTVWNRRQLQWEEKVKMNSNKRRYGKQLFPLIRARRFFPISQFDQKMRRSK